MWIVFWDISRVELVAITDKGGEDWLRKAEYRRSHCRTRTSLSVPSKGAAIMIAKAKAD